MTVCMVISLRKYRVYTVYTYKCIVLANPMHLWKLVQSKGTKKGRKPEPLNPVRACASAHACTHTGTHTHTHTQTHTHTLTKTNTHTGVACHIAFDLSHHGFFGGLWLPSFFALFPSECCVRLCVQEYVHQYACPRVRVCMCAQVCF